jgi:hypothetical protein
MKYLATYVLFIIAISALALSGNKVFFILAQAYNYLIYGVVGILVIIVFVAGFVADKNG